MGAFRRLSGVGHPYRLFQLKIAALNWPPIRRDRVDSISHAFHDLLPSLKEQQSRIIAMVDDFKYLVKGMRRGVQY